ncbi:hypothetical protein MTBBW1_1260057 [Desulfamplus magnetovallimortis]|uniref:Uncharacterized protein n=1 Tax=Desulfamplus magnetovallimortis TaxID=1246637 RepID=A0A1W1H6X8_9BACT|nr:hypothetical protein [Desulfamplus magnetovallimortis]SLM28135.1 hypothetical protein MTBBW1_1260057 [Desulfamplus magnetovallimortis]
MTMMKLAGSEVHLDEDGSIRKRASAENRNILAKLKGGDRMAIKRVKENKSVT